jgi:hypothetical protein
MSGKKILFEVTDPKEIANVGLDRWKENVELSRTEYLKDVNGMIGVDVIKSDSIDDLEKKGLNVDAFDPSEVEYKFLRDNIIESNKFKHDWPFYCLCGCVVVTIANVIFSVFFR